MSVRWIVSLIFAVSAFRNPEQQEKQEAPPEEPRPFVERFQKQFNFLPGGKLEVAAGLPGSCRVTGWQRSTIMVEIERIAYRLAPAQARQLLDQFPVITRWNQTSATVRTWAPPDAMVLLEANMTIYVPKEKIDVTANLFKGDFAIGGLNGWIEATLREGNIEAKSISGYFSAITQIGDLHVEMAGKHWNGHGLTAATRRGSVELRLPPDYSASLQLETMNGSLTIDFPAQTVEGQEVPLRAVSRKNASALTAAVGTGGPLLRLSTTDGDVRLTTTSTP